MKMAGRFLEFLPEAISDYREARQWYAQRSAQAAADFITEVERALKVILEAPNRWPKFHRGTRRYRLHQFPYLVIYRVFPDRVRIIAYQHGKRRSGFWWKR